MDQQQVRQNTGIWNLVPPDQFNQLMMQDPQFKQQVANRGEDLSYQQQYGSTVPKAPDFRTITDANGNINPAYKLNALGPLSAPQNTKTLQDMLSGIHENTQGFDTLNAYANSQGPSPWAQLMQTQNTNQGAQNMNAAVDSNAASTGNAYSQLASRGGLTQGAMMSIAKGGANNLNAAKQGVNFNTGQNSLGISTQDETNKLGVLQQLPGLENQVLAPQYQNVSLWGQMANSDAARQQNNDQFNQNYLTGVNQFNTTNALNNNSNLNQFNLDRFKTNMAAFGANKTADAMQYS